MRIIAGKYRGRVLTSFNGKDIRPTSDKAREALFSILQNEIGGASFLDLFAGTGTVAFEALSRGAGKATLVDSSRQAYNVIKNNAHVLGCDIEAYNIPAMYALNKFIDLKKKFDIIFLDPPYKTTYGEEALEIIAKNNLLADDGVVILEKGVDDTSEDFQVEGMDMVSKRKYGIAIFRFYRKAQEEVEDIENVEE